MSANIQRVIKRKAKPYVVIRANNEANTYDDTDGIAVKSESEVETVMIHWQPIKKTVTDGVAAQRSLGMKTGWTWEEIQDKDIVEIGDFKYTVNDCEEWEDVFTMFVLSRSGPTENKVES